MDSDAKRRLHGNSSAKSEITAGKIEWNTVLKWLPEPILRRYGMPIEASGEFIIVVEHISKTFANGVRAVVDFSTKITFDQFIFWNT